MRLYNWMISFLLTTDCFFCNNYKVILKKWSDFFPDCCQCVDTMVPTDCSDDGSETWSWPAPLVATHGHKFDAVDNVSEGRSRSTESTRRCFSDLSLDQRAVATLCTPERRSQLTLTPVRGRTWAEHHEDPSQDTHSEKGAELRMRGLMSVPCFRSSSPSSRPWPRRGRSPSPPPRCCWGPWPGWGCPAWASCSRPGLSPGRCPL